VTSFLTTLDSLKQNLALPTASTFKSKLAHFGNLSFKKAKRKMCLPPDLLCSPEHPNLGSEIACFEEAEHQQKLSSMKSPSVHTFTSYLVMHLCNDSVSHLCPCYYDFTTSFGSERPSSFVMCLQILFSRRCQLDREKNSVDDKIKSWTTVIRGR